MNDDYIICKKKYYKWTQLSVIPRSEYKFLNFFRKPFFEKGKKYKVLKWYKYSSGTYGTSGSAGTSGFSGTSGINTSTTTACLVTTSTTTIVTTTYAAGNDCMVYGRNDEMYLNADFLSEYFYSKKEERCIKLKKLKDKYES